MTEALLLERQKTHGEFRSHAWLSQTAAKAYRASPHWNTLDADMQESIEMILHKIARIVNGLPEHLDHWEDIKGYAELVAQRLRG